MNLTARNHSFARTITRLITVQYIWILMRLSDIHRRNRRAPGKRRFSTGFRENLYSVGNGIKNFFIQFIIHIPSIVVFLAMVGILALIVRFIIRMEQKHSQRVQEKRKKQQMQQVQQIQNIQEGKKDAGK